MSLLLKRPSLPSCNISTRAFFFSVDPARIELATIQCECIGMPLTYGPYSTVTLFAKFLGLSTSKPFNTLQ